MLLDRAAIPKCLALPTPFRRDVASQSFRETWKGPEDTLSILLVIGGDVVLKALAQLSGRTLIPVAFSFGWVAYSFNTLMHVVGDGRLMPPPDFSCKVINTENGYARDNKSWLLGRLLRDHEDPLPDSVGLKITVFETDPRLTAGVASIDEYWLSGLVVIAVQLGIAAVPYVLHRNWSVMLVTAGGTVLALATGILLPQWRAEKWACRRNTKKVVSLTGGNGSRHVMVIIGNGSGLDLEDLAQAETPRIGRNSEQHRWRKSIGGLPATLRLTQIVCSVLAVLWIVVLVTVTSLEQDTWYLLAVGGLGMAQNVVVAGARRIPSTSGIHIKKIEVFEQFKVMHALMDLEEAYPRVGKSLLPIFFSATRPAEARWWDGDKEEYERDRKEKRPDTLMRRKLTERIAEARRNYATSIGIVIAKQVPESDPPSSSSSSSERSMSVLDGYTAPAPSIDTTSTTNHDPVSREAEASHSEAWSVVEPAPSISRSNPQSHNQIPIEATTGQLEGGNSVAAAPSISKTSTTSNDQVPIDLKAETTHLEGGDRGSAAPASSTNENSMTCIDQAQTTAEPSHSEGRNREKKCPEEGQNKSEELYSSGATNGPRGSDIGIVWG